jgi:phosphoglucosamine mutase
MKLFGTDGVRGKYGEKITDELAYNLGKATGKLMNENEIKKIFIGQDPRFSSVQLEKELTKGLLETGVEVAVTGVIPTAVVSYLIVNEAEKAMGIMISASHNPYYDNGIKFFGTNGKKASDDVEAEIERIIDENDYQLEVKDGKVEKINAEEKYLAFLESLVKDLDGLNVALDCANGSAFSVAPKLFEKLGANVSAIATNPDGKNINDGVGSTHPEAIESFMKEGTFDVGFAFDGDSDRVMLFDGEGNLYDGDYIIYLLAKELKKQGKLNNDQVVVTVMANLGLINALEENNITAHKAKVGDRFVMQFIDEFEASLGGEQSGHIILPDYITTGDGLLAAVILADIIKKKPETFKVLKDEMKKLPQVLINVKVEDKEVVNHKDVQDLIKEEEQILENSGRVLLRPSGTEPLVRVMVEAETEEKCQEVAEKIASKIEELS